MTKVTRFRLFVICCTAVVLAPPIQAQYTPESGSSERKAVIDALRVPVQRELRKPVVFRDVRLRVSGSWAIVDTATPAKPDLTEFDYRGSNSAYARCVNRGDDDCGDPQYSAILRKTNNRWQVMKFGSGATDVWIGYACSKIRGCPRDLQ